MTVMTNPGGEAWGPIVQIDRRVQLPEDHTLHRAAVWWEVYSELPDDQTSRMWATYVADVWQYSVQTLDSLRAGVEWIERSAEEMSERVVDAKAKYDDAIREWREGSEDWSALEAEKTRRLIRYMIASQQRLVAAMVAQGETSADRVRRRLIEPYVAGYLSGLASNWCDSNGFASDDPRCAEQMLAIFREFFGSRIDDETATIFFERWSGEVECIDGMLHAHEDVSSFKRWERGVRIIPRMRLFEHLAG